MSAERDLLPPATRRAIEEIGGADVVVGIPSFNNARTIGHVVQAAHAGLAKYFPRLKALIVNSDGGSTDGTPDIVRRVTMPEHDLLLISHPLHPVHRLTIPYHGIPGKGSAFRCVFRVAELLGARACAVVDSDLRSISPEWIHLLVAPVLEEGYDYVAPYYLRHKYDGTITNSIVYPLTRALYGARVRQPIGGDFGFSGRLAGHYLRKAVWDSDVARYGIDIWMTTTAICEGFRVCQSFLGTKLHDAKDPGADLSAMLVQVLGTVFSLMETYESIWIRATGSRPTPVMGFQFQVGVEPIDVDVRRLVAHFRTGVANLTEVWATFVDRADLQRLEALASGDAGTFAMTDDLWVRLVCAFAVGYHHRLMDRPHLVRSILPLYMGRVASFVGEVAARDACGCCRRRTWTGARRASASFRGLSASALPVSLSCWHVCCAGASCSWRSSRRSSRWIHVQRRTWWVAFSSICHTCWSRWSSDGWQPRQCSLRDVRQRTSGPMRSIQVGRPVSRTARVGPTPERHGVRRQHTRSGPWVSSDCRG